MNEKLKELDERLFSNVGADIKKVTKIVFWVETAIAALAAIIFLLGGLTNPPLLAGTIMCLILPIFFWLGSLAMYGFGELIDRVIKLSNTPTSSENKSKSNSKTDSSKRLSEIEQLYAKGVITAEEYKLAIEKEN